MENYLYHASTSILFAERALVALLRSCLVVFEWYARYYQVVHLIALAHRCVHHEIPRFFKKRFPIRKEDIHYSCGRKQRLFRRKTPRGCIEECHSHRDEERKYTSCRRRRSKLSGICCHSIWSNCRWSAQTLQIVWV